MQTPASTGSPRTSGSTSVVAVVAVVVAVKPLNTLGVEESSCPRRVPRTIGTS